MKKLYQNLTFWLGVKRMLMLESCNNYGKLLSTGLSEVWQRTTDTNKTTYYKLRTDFGYARFYRYDYIDKTTNKNVNVFTSCVIPALCGEDESDRIITKKVLLCSGWVLTQKQGIKMIKQIQKASRDLRWCSPPCDEKYSYCVAKNALDYLNGKHTYFSCDGDKGLREAIYLIQRDIENKVRYVYDIQQIMYKVLERNTKKRNAELKVMLGTLLQKFETDGYKKFWLRYFD